LKVLEDFNLPITNTLEELLKVDVSYRESLKELGKTEKQLRLMGDYASLFGVLLKIVQTLAIELLNTAII